MPGPMPKDPAMRQRRNKSSTKAMLPAEPAPRLRRPKLPVILRKTKVGDVEMEAPIAWHAMAEAFWCVVWESPMHHEFLRADEPALIRLLMLVHIFWSTGGDLAMAKEIRMMEREFGLTPLSRRRLEWTVAQAEEARDRHEEKRIARAGPVIDLDTRGVLES
jgi:hypothetical protein